VVVGVSAAKACCQASDARGISIMPFAIR